MVRILKGKIIVFGKNSRNHSVGSKIILFFNQFETHDARFKKYGGDQLTHNFKHLTITFLETTYEQKRILVPTL